MSDLYTELLVKKTASLGDKALKIVLIGLTILAGLAGIFISSYVFLAFIALAVIDYLLLPSLDLEYEYLYVNGELDIDKIMSRTKRKHAASYSINQAEVVAPVKSHELDYYRQDKNIKVRDFSSREPEAGIFAMIISREDKREMILFEPNEVILNDMRRIAPRKVKLS